MPLGLNPKNFFPLYFTCWFLQSLGIVVLDIGTDILAIHDKQERKPIVSGIFMIGGLAAGELFIGAFSFIFEIDYSIGFFIVGLISTIAIVISLLFNEKTHIQQEYSKPVSLKNMLMNIKQKNILLGAFFGIFLMLDSGLLEFTLERFLFNQFSKTLSELFILNIVSTISFLIISPILYKMRLKLNTPLFLAIISFIFAFTYIDWAVLLFMGQLTFALFMIIFIITAIIGAVGLVLHTSFFFEISKERAAGAQIVFLLTSVAIGRITGIFIGGYIYDIGGMLSIFVICAIIMCVRAIPLFLIKK
ncbi:MAG: hypothetical protein GF329_02835 [Candidatus Lokiarchaeota archaeon]|nr:hypothetical protein [Candidatus Lokiarchaeota archaeon]